MPSVRNFEKRQSKKRAKKPKEEKFVVWVARLSYYERSIVAFANILFEKSILTPEQLARKARKMDEVATRYRQSPAARG
jgi:hypothetical protein